MARGRKPDSQNVIPMADEAFGHLNLDERARMRLDEIRPEGLTGQLLWTFDRLALPLCHPTVNRLNPTNVFMFRMLCQAVVRHERLALEIEEFGETYETGKGRNGNQVRPHPNVAQFNATFRQIQSLAGEFGMTPSTERGLNSGSQLMLELNDPNSPESYLT